MAGEGQVEVFRSPLDSEWYFHLKAGNGEVISQSEGYKNKQDAIDMATKAHPGFEMYVQGRLVDGS